MTNQETMSLLAGDGSVPESDAVDVVLMDDLATSTGDHVLRADRARDALVGFVYGTEAMSLGEWHEL